MKNERHPRFVRISPEANLMESAKRLYHLTGTSDQIESELSSLAVSDKESEAETAKYKRSQGVGCTVAFIATFASPFLAALLGGDTSKPKVMLVWVLGGAAFLFGLVKWAMSYFAAGRAEEGDVDDFRYEGLQRLHSFLKHDCAENAVFDYHLELRKYWDKAFFQKQEDFGGVFRYPKGKFVYYSTPAIIARYKLRDGTSLKITITRESRVKDYQKKNPRGKVKSKWKVKHRDHYRLDIKLPGKLGSSQVASAPPPASLRGSGKKAPKIKFEGNKVSAFWSAKTGQQPLSVDPALKLATWVFQRLKKTNAA